MSKAMQELFEDVRNEVKIETSMSCFHSIIINLNVDVD